MKKLIFFLLILSSPAWAGYALNPYTGKFDRCLTIKETDGSPKNITCGDVKVSNGSLTDNLDGTYTLSTGSSGGSGSGTVNSGLLGQLPYYVGTSTVGPSANVYIQGNNLGVGTVGPTTALQVVGTAVATAFSGPLTGNASTSTALAANGSNCTAGNYPLGVDASGASEGCTAVTSSQWATQNTTDVSLAGGNVGIGTTIPNNAALVVMNGNVGIGTWKPTLTVDISGTLRATGAIRSDNSYSISGQTALTLTGTTYTSTASNTTNTSSSAGSNIAVVGGANAGSFITLRSTSASGTSDFLRFNTGNNTERARFDTNGNLGIGTITPVSRLTVVGASDGVAITDTVNDTYVTTVSPSGGMIIKGNVGIATVNPGAPAEVAGNFRIAQGGFFVSQQTTAPTVANNDCGTTAQGTVAANSSDLLGTVTAGTLNVTSCAMTFNKTHNTAPLCICEDATSILGVKCTTTTTKLTITSTTSMSGDVITYFCPTNIP